jgi:hypothetical protein
MLYACRSMPRQGYKFASGTRWRRAHTHQFDISIYSLLTTDTCGNISHGITVFDDKVIQPNRTTLFTTIMKYLIGLLLTVVSLTIVAPQSLHEEDTLLDTAQSSALRVLRNVPSDDEDFVEGLLTDTS